jgi:drug/metabolite transporter superfamily protein YnfA
MKENPSQHSPFMLWPGKFVPRKASKLEHNLVVYTPPQFLAFGTFGLFAPGTLLEYWIFQGHIFAGSIGLLLWMALLWLLLIEIHNVGRVRFWLSAPIALIGHVLIALWFAGRI